LCRGSKAKTFKLVRPDYFLYAMTNVAAWNEQHKLLARCNEKPPHCHCCAFS